MLNCSMDQVRCCELSPVIRDGIAIQIALRSFGYSKNSLSRTISDKGGASISLEYEGKVTTFEVGETLGDPQALLKKWEWAAKAYEDGRMADVKLFYNTSKVQEYLNDYKKQIKSSGISFPGPETRN